MKKVIAIVVLIILASCQKKTEKKFGKLEKMHWLVGSWEQKLPDGILTETWSKENDSTFKGESYFINLKDTVHFEKIKLHQNVEKLIYSATVVGQNNNKPIDFLMTSAIENTFTFENPAHDYPQKIIYKKVSESSFVATISGKQQGKDSKESYSMTKK